MQNRPPGDKIYMFLFLFMIMWAVTTVYIVMRMCPYY